MNLTELHSFNLNDAVKFHSHLNPAIFDGDQMNNTVRDRLLIIARDFIDHLGIPDIDIEDITVSGSNAAYSYTDHSDIDLHILVDFRKFNNDDVYRELFDAKKTTYNNSHDIIINGYEVELYVQDTNEPVISLGEYSVMHDKWLRLPRKRKAHLDQQDCKLKYNKLAKLIEYALKSEDSSKIEKLLTKLKKYRQAGLDTNGEFSSENVVFKALRTQGLIKKLYAKLAELHSKKLSLPESKLLDKPTPTVAELAKKHGISVLEIAKQLDMGIKSEQEHTSDRKIAREIALDHLSEKPNYYTLLNTAGLEEGSSGYIPSKAQKNDPRFKTALSVDIHPDTMQKNAKKLGWNISRAGIPPLLRK